MAARIAALVRSNGWALPLVFIALGAYFVAGAVNAVLARSIRVVPTADDMFSSGMSSSPLLPTRQAFGAIADRNLFGVKREVLNPGGAQGAAAEPNLVSGRNYDPSNLKPCSLTVNVRATLVADGAPEWSLAVLFVNNDNQVFSVNEGSNKISDDAYLVDVLERAVVVRRRDHFERCAADSDTTGTALAAMATPQPQPSVGPGELNPNDMTGVTKISDSQYRVDRAEVDKALNNLAEVSTQARIVPSFKNGVANGFKMFSIKPGSIYSKIGLQNGDVIHKINGYEMNSPDKALEIYQKLKDATSVQIELERRGTGMNVNYNIGG
jgi:general secretion pathway protein C